jgi:hypothetical protein
MAEPFSIQINSPKLIRGLRPSTRMPRDSGYLIQCQGAIGHDGSLQELETLTRIATTAITDPFPYPQIFTFTNLIVVCGQTAIYEWIPPSTLTLRLGSLTAGSTWSAVEFFDFLYLSNGIVAVVRRATDKVFAIDTTLPKAEAMVNFNGQVIVGGLLA